MKKSILLILLSFVVSQNPVSDQGLDQIVEPGDIVTISGAASEGADGTNNNLSYQWTVPQEILDINPGMDVQSETITFTAPNVEASSIYSIYLTVTDGSSGNTSQEYDSPSLIITGYMEIATGNPSANRHLEIYNGTGSTITSDEWQNYEIWLAKNGADFENPDQDFHTKLLFHRTATEDDVDHDLDLDEITTIFPNDLEHDQTLTLVNGLGSADSDITEHNVVEWGGMGDAKGDDGIALVKGGLPVDTIGEGDDPDGGGWDIAGVEDATKDHALVRKSTVALGNYGDWTNSAGTNEDDSEWFVIDDADFSYVGSHDCTACDNVVNVIVAIPPVANAGDDFTTCDEIVVLNGSGNSNDVEYTYTWTGPGAVPLTGADTATPTFTPPTSLSSDTQYDFELVINDGYVDSDPDIVTVTVEANLCPVANAGDDVRYRLNTVNDITLSGDSSYDPNVGDVLSYEWELLGGNTSLTLTPNGSDLVISDLPTVLAENPTQYQVKLTVVDDGSQSSDPDTMNIFIGDFAAPDSPNLYAVAYSDYIKLSWDFVSESSLDPLTQYADFEGYKLYKSEDGGQTWCSPEDKIYDFDGNEAGCRPLAQFDLTEDQDNLHCVYKEGYSSCESVRGENIVEYDPESGWLYLGSNSGLEHIYIDEDVVDGMEYTYTLTAYDMGVRTYTIDYEYLEDSASGEPIYEQVTNWSLSNPDQWTSVGQSQVSLDVEENYGVTYIESALGSDGDNNFVQVVPGSLPVNITDPLTDDAESYINPDNDNIGNAARYFDIVDKTSIKDTHLKFEIQAEYGLDGGNIVNSFEGNKCENPTLYVWETDEDERAVDVSEIPIPESYSEFFTLSESDLPGFAPYGGNWDSFIDLLLNSNLSGEIDEESWDIVRGFLIESGFTSFGTPNYLVEGMPITFSDELGADQNWTDLIYGVRFKFDNGYLYYESAKEGDQYIPAILDAYTEEANGDSTLMTSLFISDDRKTEIMYYSGQIFDMRPPYKYKIEFSDEPEYPAYDCFTNIGATNCGCTDAEGVPSLPFQVTNITTGQPVSLRIKDNGVNDGVSEDDDGEIVQNDPDLDGRKDCFWTRSERVLFKEMISTYYTPVEHLMSTSYPNEDNYTYELNLDYFMFREFNTEFWDEGYDYQQGEQVQHQSMIWKASSLIPNNIPPPTGNDPANGPYTGESGRKGWYDCGSDLKCNEDEEGYDASTNPDPEGDDYPLGDEGDGLNDNPWVPVYPWKDGDVFYFTPIAWYADGDNWTVDLGEIGARESVTQEDVDNVYVAPNPYRGESSFDSVYGEETIYFKNLPSPCDISIYTVTGKLVDEFSFVDTGGAGQYPWHLTNSSGEKIAPGLYIFYVESEGKNEVGKFAIVR